MASLNEMELQNIRHLLQFGEADHEKFQQYANQSTDASVKQFFQKSAQSATKNKDTIMKFL